MRKPSPMTRRNKASPLLLLLRAWRKAEIEIARFQRVLVGAQRRVVGRFRHVEPRRQRAVEQAQSLEIVEPGQVAKRLQPKMRQKFRGCPISERPSRGLAAAARADPAGFKQHVERPLGGRNAANLLDLGAGHGLMIGDDGKRLDRGTGKFFWLD